MNKENRIPTFLYYFICFLVGSSFGVLIRHILTFAVDLIINFNFKSLFQLGMFLLVTYYFARLFYILLSSVVHDEITYETIKDLLLIG